MSTIMSETKIKVCKKLWTDRKAIQFIQVIETPSKKYKNSNLELDKVSFVNVKYDFHKGLKHQKYIFQGQSFQKVLIELNTGEKSKILNSQMGFSLEFVAKTKLYLKM